MKFKLSTPFAPAGDQEQAIKTIVHGLQNGKYRQTLKGVTGSGKTFTMAKIIEKIQKPTLVLSHNKTLAAQLFREFKDFFSENAVEYFVSYYDYYQPEAYVAKKDLYIDKDVDINQEIERLRNSATVSLMERNDIIVVATVSCIYGLGNPVAYKDFRMTFRVGQKIASTQLKYDLVQLHYVRNQDVLEHGTFRVSGDLIEIYPSYTDNIYALHTEWDIVTAITILEPITRNVLSELESITVYPAKHFVVPEAHRKAALTNIRSELTESVLAFRNKSKLVEAQRLQTRTRYDLEMMEEIGYCSGIENYSRHLSMRKAGERPAVLLDYFPEDFITFIDESHVTIPQVRGMYAGDRARKQSLVENGFRLPSALDNRPLVFEEFEKMTPKTIYVSATPKEEEMSKSFQVVEQVIRPTGLVDPEIEVRPTSGQIEHLIAEIKKRIAANERTLVTTLTKKLSEQLADYFKGIGINTQYIHSELDTIERVEILTALRSGTYDVLVGINLLREGLDLPEVSLIAIMDADKIGFLRSETALIQTIGRAARNINGKVIMYADAMSHAMESAIRETDRRRAIQHAHNKKHNITPQTITKNISAILVRTQQSKKENETLNVNIIKDKYNVTFKQQRNKLIKELEALMTTYAKDWEFERAAVVRDEIQEIKALS